jgi:hypothetical protein
VPPVTTPVVTVPAVTTPAVRVPPPARPAPRAPAPQVPSIPAPPQSSAPHVGATGGATARSGARSRVGGAETSREQTSRLRLARDRRTVVIPVPRPARVELEVRELSPECRLVRRFRAHVHRGSNRLRLRNHALTPGTYTIEARSLRTGRVLAHARLVVGNAASRAADSCGGATSTAGVSRPGNPPAAARRRSSDPKATKPPRHQRGVLGARFGWTALSRAEDVPVWVYGLLALAVGLLAAGAALPKSEPRSLSASLMIGSVGAAILLGLTIAFALG